MGTSRFRAILIRRRRIFVAAALLFALGVTLVRVSVYHEPPDQQARRIAHEQGIEVIFGDPRSFRSAGHPDMNVLAEGMHAETPEPDRVSAALDGIELALRTYPSGYTRKLIRTIYICGALYADDTRASGTIRADWIIIAAAADRKLEHVRWESAATLHHELSSAVLRRDDNLVRWRSFWPGGRREIHAYDEVSTATDVANPDPSTGFLSAYATSNPENDFNEYAEQLFMNAERTIALARVHPKVRAKLAVLVDAYTRIDRRMVAVFERLGVGRLRS